MKNDKNIKKQKTEKASEKTDEKTKNINKKEEKKTYQSLLITQII